MSTDEKNWPEIERRDHPQSDRRRRPRVGNKYKSPSSDNDIEKPLPRGSDKEKNE